MPKKVLIFESDGAFATELSEGLRRLGCEVSVTDDASVGLQTAATIRPDVILLSIELPRMNGFSVCNRIRRDPGLKDIPLIIMSTDSTEETFEQHRRLRTRADDYVHKPISFQALLSRIQALVSLDVPAPTVEEDVVVDEEVVLDEEVVVGEAEVARITEQAFDVLMGTSAPPPAPSSAPRSAESAAVTEADIIPASAGGVVVPFPSSRPATDQIRELERELGQARTQLQELERELGRARAELSELRQKAERGREQSQLVETLQREVEDLRQRLSAASGGKSGVSARELLDLREVLNRKDRELLDLRDQLTRKDKELLGLRDHNLALERERAELNERLLELEKQLLDLTRTADAAKADKEQAAKRADDLKRRLERVSADLEARTKELATLREAHEAEMARRDTIEAGLRAERQQLMEKAAAELKAAVAQAEEQGRQNLTRALAEAEQAAERARTRAIEQVKAEASAVRERLLADREAELRHEFEGKLAGMRRAHEETLSKLKAEHEQVAHELLEGKRSVELELERVRLELGELRRDKQQSEAARDARILALERELSERTAERDAARRQAEEHLRTVAGLETDLRERTAERDEARRAREERDRRVAELESELGAARSETAGVRSELERERQRLEQARAKWNQDRVSLERAKDALAVALAQIEETETRSLG